VGALFTIPALMNSAFPACKRRPTGSSES